MNTRVVGKRVGRGPLRPQGIISGTRERVQDLLLGFKGRQSSVLAIQRRPPTSQKAGPGARLGYGAPPGAASGLSEGWGEAGRAGLLGGLRGAPRVPEF